MEMDFFLFEKQNFWVSEQKWQQFLSDTVTTIRFQMFLLNVPEKILIISRQARRLRAQNPMYFLIEIKKKWIDLTLNEIRRILVGLSIYRLICL